MAINILDRLEEKDWFQNMWNYQCHTAEAVQQLFINEPKTSTLWHGLPKVLTIERRIFGRSSLVMLISKDLMTVTDMREQIWDEWDKIMLEQCETYW